MENNYRVPCPKACGNGSFLKEKENLNELEYCYTCEGQQTISSTLGELLQLGFMEMDHSRQYRISLVKVLNPLQSLQIEVVRENNEYLIATIESKGPNLDSVLERIGTKNVEPLIKFLKGS